MDEYAAQTNSPNDSTHPEQFAAASVGVSAKVRAGWDSYRLEKKTGIAKPNIADRVRMNFEEGGGGAG